MSAGLRDTALRRRLGDGGRACREEGGLEEFSAIHSGSYAVQNITGHRFSYELRNDVAGAVSCSENQITTGRTNGRTSWVINFRDPY